MSSPMVAAVQRFLSASLARALQVMPCSAVFGRFPIRRLQAHEQCRERCRWSTPQSETRLESARAAAMLSDLMGTFMIWPPEGVAPFPAYPG